MRYFIKFIKFDLYILWRLVICAIQPGFYTVKTQIAATKGNLCIVRQSHQMVEALQSKLAESDDFCGHEDLPVDVSVFSNVILSREGPHFYHANIWCPYDG